jgi:two-component system, chemotaxis family, chemotaxis protein CheY
MSAGNLSPRDAHVLVVDDEPQMVGIIEGVLGILGVSKVETATDGKEALDLVKAGTTPFDLVICDWQMPNMDGLQFLDAFRGEYPGTTFVMLTAKTDVKAFNDAKRSGATYFFMKPIDAGDLKSRLSSLFDQMTRP